MIHIVIVFCNEKPDIGKLSKDRWKIFKIIEKDLVDVSPSIKNSELEENRKMKSLHQYYSDSD